MYMHTQQTQCERAHVQIYMYPLLVAQVCDKLAHLCCGPILQNEEHPLEGHL